MTPRFNPTTRRSFLTQSATTAGVFSLGACASTTVPTGQHPIQAPAKAPIPEGTPVRIGLIGTGGMGGGHLGSMMHQIASKQAHFEVVALADVNSVWLEEKAHTARKGQSGVKVDTYSDYTKLLERDDIDGVLIATPEHWHAKMSMDAIAAGKDVYCEKPMTTSIEEALWMVNVMKANPHMRLQVGTQYMRLEKYQVAKKLIADGEIGHPTLSQTSYCRNTPAGEWNYYKIDDRVIPGETLDWEAWCGNRGVRDWDPKLYHRWRRYKDFSTGIIGDLLVHMMTPMMDAIDRGWPTRVAAIGGHFIDHDMENHDQVFLNVGMEKDHTMIVAGSTINATGLEVLIRGNRANIYLGSNNCEVRPEHVYAEDIEPRTIQCKNVDAQPALRLDWINCIRTREQNVSQVELAAKVMVAVDLSTRAMWQGGTWTFDPAAPSYGPEYLKGPK